MGATSFFERAIAPAQEVSHMFCQNTAIAKEGKTMNTRSPITLPVIFAVAVLVAVSALAYAAGE